MGPTTLLHYALMRFTKAAASGTSWPRLARPKEYGTALGVATSPNHYLTHFCVSTLPIRQRVDRRTIWGAHCNGTADLNGVVAMYYEVGPYPSLVAWLCCGRGENASSADGPEATSAGLISDPMPYSGVICLFLSFMHAHKRLTGRLSPRARSTGCHGVSCPSRPPCAHTARSSRRWPTAACCRYLRCPPSTARIPPTRASGGEAPAAASTSWSAMMNCNGGGDMAPRACASTGNFASGAAGTHSSIPPSPRRSRVKST